MPDERTTPKEFKGEDLTGRKFGRWNVISFLSSIDGKASWNCRCDCGTESVVRSNGLKSGGTKSCGCYRVESARSHQTKHGHKTRTVQTRTYKSWCGMKERCLVKTNKRYEDYAGRGITICDRWIHSFENFLEDMGECPEGLTLHRVDNDGNYELGNCIWADAVIQANSRRSSRFEIAFGKRQTLAEWARESGIPYYRLVWRTNRHGIERALTMPCRGRTYAK